METEVSTSDLRNAYENIKVYLKEYNDKPSKFDVVQLNEKTKNEMFTACFMTVTEVKEWGVQGYVQIPGKDGGQAYYRAENGTFDWIGRTNFVLADEEEQ